MEPDFWVEYETYTAKHCQLKDMPIEAIVVTNIAHAVVGTAVLLNFWVLGQFNTSVGMEQMFSDLQDSTNLYDNDIGGLSPTWDSHIKIFDKVF